VSSPARRRLRASTLVAAVLVVLAAAAAYLVTRGGGLGSSSWSAASTGTAPPSSAGPSASPTGSATAGTASTTVHGDASPRTTVVPGAAVRTGPVDPTAGDPSRNTSGPVFTTEPPASVVTDAPTTAGKGRADVAVSYAAWDATSSSVEVDAYVGALVEDGGTCRLTLTKGPVTRTVSGAASADATTTICDPLSVAGAQLSTGTWRVVVAYRSASSSGTAAPVEVVVP